MSVERIVLASSNPGKLREIQAVLSFSNLTLVPQSDFNVADADETGSSFVENAIIKARHAAECTGLPALADDSGIEVDYLQGAPGVYSARYAGNACDDQANNQKLLTALDGIEESRRTARFQCVLVLMRHAQDAMPLICTGTWEGRILSKEVGSHGFGYDPLFYVPTHGCASAELDPGEKNRISHRAQALQCLSSQIQAYLTRT